jgi:nitroreductase
VEAILSRRSIRKFTKEPVSDEIVKELLKAAMSAPSAVNQQPWHFIVIRERQILDEIPKIQPYSQMLRDAPVAVVVCGDLNLEKAKGFWVQDCSAATQNILIAVQVKGLGAVWLGFYPREDRIKALQKLLDIPKHVIPFSVIPIGYSAEQKPPASRYNESRIHYDRW